MMAVCLLRSAAFLRCRSTTASRPAFQFNKQTGFRRAARSQTRRLRLVRVRLLMVTMLGCRFTSTRRRCFKLQQAVVEVLVEVARAVAVTHAHRDAVGLTLRT